MHTRKLGADTNVSSKNVLHITLTLHSTCRLIVVNCCTEIFHAHIDLRKLEGTLLVIIQSKQISAKPSEETLCHMGHVLKESIFDAPLIVLWGAVSRYIRWREIQVLLPWRGVRVQCSCWGGFSLGPGELESRGQCLKAS